MNGFALLWNKILDSSIWVKESKETRLVWIAILAMKNSHGLVHASTVGLAHRAKVSVEECKEALRVLLSPDPDDTSKVEEGRRIREIKGGWEVVNHDLYRFSTETKREFWRIQKAEQRKTALSKVKKKSKPANGELAHEKAFNAGASQEQLDKMSDPDFLRETPPPYEATSPAQASIR